MATYNSSTFDTDNQYIKYRIQAVTNSQNIANSTTNVTFKVQVWRTNTGYTTYGSGTAYLEVAGTTYTASITTNQKFSYNSYTTVLTKTVNVPRGEAGNASTYARARISHDRFTASWHGYTFKFPVINRYALLSTVQNFTDEGNPTITYTNPAGTELVTDLQVRLTWNSGAGATDYVSVPDEGGSFTFSLTAAQRAAMLAACPNSNTLAVQFDLKSTMNETEYHSTKDAAMEVVNANPTAGAVTYMDINSATVAKTGDNQKIVQLHSTLQIHTAASTAKKSATIATYKLEINGNEYTPDANGNVTFTNPNVIGTYTATVTTTDSRGNTAVATIDIEILERSEPSAVYSLARVDNFYTNTILNVDGKISPIAGTNTLTITEKHRKIGDSTWSTPATVPDATDTTLQLNNLYDWEVLITVSDEYGSTEYTATVGKGIPIAFFDIKKHSVGINGFPDADEQLYVGGSIKATGDINTAGDMQCDKITANKMSTTEGTATFTKSSGSWTFNNGEYTRSGSTIQLRLAFKGGGSNVAVGGNSIAGTVNGIPKPPYTVRLFGYYSGTVLMGELTEAGAFNVRILGQALNLSTSNTATLSGTFITEE